MKLRWREYSAAMCEKSDESPTGMYKQYLPRIVAHNRRDSVRTSSLVQHTDMTCTEAPTETTESIPAVYLQYCLASINRHQYHPGEPNNDSPDHCGPPRSPSAGSVKTCQKRLHPIVCTSTYKPRKRSLNQSKAETLVKARYTSLLLFEHTIKVSLTAEQTTKQV